MSARAPLSHFLASRIRLPEHAASRSADDLPAFGRRALLTGAFSTAAVALARPARATGVLLSGRVYSKEPMALPADAVVEVSLLDVSRADAPARALAERRFMAQGRNPLPFVLTYDPAEMTDRGRYALRARILSGNALLFTGTGGTAVPGPGAGRADIRVERVAAAGEVPAAPKAASPVGRWLAEDIKGGGVIDRARTFLEIDAGGRVSGSGGCNRLSARALISGPSITFAMVATTRMACAPAVMDQEQRFLAALSEVRAWRVDAATQKLHLTAADGMPLLQFAAM